MMTGYGRAARIPNPRTTRGMCQMGKPPTNRHRRLRQLLWTFFALALAVSVTACSSTFDPPVSPKPEPPDPIDPITWTGTDVGSVGLSGRFEIVGTDSAIRVLGAGHDIWGTTDSFHFVYQRATGDLDVVARIDAVDYTHEWAKAGLMVRHSLAADAPHAFMGFTPAGAAEFLRRPTAGHETYATVWRDRSLPSWVRLQRIGDVLIGSVSLDGEHWSEVDRITIDMDDEAYVGVAVTSRDPARLARADVREIGTGVDGTPTPPPGEGPGAGWACGDEPLTPSYAPTLYVATTGSDANDGRSPERPFRTLQRAANAVGPGDVVWVRGGLYSSDVAFERSGTATAPIVFESYPGECAILDGSGLDRLQRLRFWDVRYTVFRNFVVRNSPGEGIFLMRSHDNVLSHLRLHHNGLSGILNMYGDRNLFTYFVTHDNYDPPYGGDADGISVASGNANRISHCVAYNNSDDGVDTWLSTNSVVEYCVSFDNGWQGGDGNGFKAGGDYRSVNTIVRHSVAFHNKANGFDWNTGSGVTFDHNTAFGNGRYGIVANQATVRNNLSIGNASTAFSGDASASTLLNNSWQLGITDGGFVSTDPARDGFLALRPDSRAVNAGAAIGYPFSGAAPDLGALPLGETLATFLGIDLESVTGP